MFPYHLEEANFKPDQLQNKETKPEQVVLDLRSAQRKRHVLENETMSTLKREYDIWEERPRIIASEVTSEPDFSHMVHRLEHHN